MIEKSKDKQVKKAKDKTVKELHHCTECGIEKRTISKTSAVAFICPQCGKENKNAKSKTV